MARTNPNPNPMICLTPTSRNTYKIIKNCGRDAAAAATPEDKGNKRGKVLKVLWLFTAP